MLTTLVFERVGHLLMWSLRKLKLSRTNWSLSVSSLEPCPDFPELVNRPKRVRIESKNIFSWLSENK